jgi:hypothetical protein
MDTAHDILDALTPHQEESYVPNDIHTNTPEMDGALFTVTHARLVAEASVLLPRQPGPVVYPRGFEVNRDYCDD